MRFNSVFAAITFILVTSFAAMVVFVQTRSFGDLLSRVLSDVGQRKAETKVAIGNLEISVFPPGLEMVKVSVEKDFGDGKRLSAELGRVGLYLGLVEVEERKLSFGEIRLSDSVVDVTYPESTGPEMTQIESGLIDEIFNFSSHLPIRVDTVLVESTLVHANHDLLNIRRLKLFKQGDTFTTRFHVSNIKPSDDLGFAVDEVWADAEIGKRNISIQRLKVQQDVHSIVLKGEIRDWPLLKGASFQVNGEGMAYLKALKGVDLPDSLALHSGTAMVNFQLARLKGKFEGEGRLNVQDLRSAFAFADNLTAKLSLQNSNVLLSQLELSYGEQRAKLLEPTLVAQLDRKEYLGEAIRAEVRDLRLSNALRVLGPAFEPLEGRLTGRLIVKYNNGDLQLLPADGFQVSDLTLTVGKEKPLEIVRVSTASLSSSQFAVVDKEFKMSSLIALPRSSFELEGRAGKKGVHFAVSDGKVNLEDLGNIARLGITGAGNLSVSAEGPLDEVVLGFKGKMADFSVLDYRLGNAELELAIALGDSTVTIKKFESTQGKTGVSGNGAINYKSQDIALGIHASSASFTDLSQILHPILSKLDFLPQDLELTAKIDAYIHGKTKLPQLKVKSHVEYTDLVAYGETVNNGSFNIGLANETVSIANFEGSKERGIITGNFAFNLPSDRLSLKFGWDNLSLSSFNLARKLGLNLEGYLSGSVEGEGQVKDYVLELKTDLSETASPNYKYDDSILRMKIMPGRIAGEASLLGRVARTDFDWSYRGDRRSAVKLKVDAPEVKPFLVALLGQHLEPEDFRGRAIFELEAGFDRNLEALDLRGELKELGFTHESFRVNYRSQGPQFLVEDSKIQNWNLAISEPDLFVRTRGTGVLGKDFSLVNEFHLNAKLAELFLSRVLSSQGVLKNVVRIEGRGNDHLVTASSNCENLSISIEGAPFALNEMRYSIDYSNQRLVINELVTSLDSGTASLKGDIFMGGQSPDVNIKYQLNKAEIPILGKSSMNLSGEGIILGSELPYALSGEITVNRAQIVNELSDFENKSVAQVRFLPKSQESFIGKLFSLNLNVKAESPVRVTNSLMDVALRGEVRLSGSPLKPRAEGRVFAPVNSSRIFFKNNEYFITNADLNFSAKKEITNPDFDVQAMTFISSYKINAKAYGDLDRFNFDLTSDPALPRNSILSLIAFGYTDEIQSTLSQGEQQNLTQVGVGSFVFDRFKISDILNKQFGLQVNLGTVFEQSQTQSMLSGRSQDGQGALGRTRSATKIELKKRLDDALSLSVSSTMGGSIGQRQSMNLTYSLNKKVQLEGVYELRTNAEGEEDVIDNSVGGDVKIRWTFK